MRFCRCGKHPSAVVMRECLGVMARSLKGQGAMRGAMHASEHALRNWVLPAANMCLTALAELEGQDWIDC